MEVPPQIVGDTVDPSADVLVEEPALEKTWKFLLNREISVSYSRVYYRRS